MNRKPRINLSILVLMLIDVFLINVAVFIGLYTGFQEKFSQPRIDSFVQIAPWISLIGLGIYSSFDMYERKPHKINELLWSSALTGLEVAFIPNLILHFFGQQALPLERWIFSGVTAFIFLFLWHWKQGKIYKLLEHGRGRLLVIGEKEKAIYVVKELLKNSTHRYTVEGYIDPEYTQMLWRSLVKVDAILLVPGIASEVRNKIITICMEQSKTIFVYNDKESSIVYNSRPVNIGDLTLLKINPAAKDIMKLKDDGEKCRKTSIKQKDSNSLAAVYDLKKEKVIRYTKFEYCAICGKKTNVRREEPIENRVGYVEGVGQLCQECFKKLYKP